MIHSTRFSGVRPARRRFSPAWLLLAAQLLLPQPARPDAPAAQPATGPEIVIAPDGRPIGWPPAAPPAEPMDRVRVLFSDAAGKPVPLDLAARAEAWCWVVRKDGSADAGQAEVVSRDGSLYVALRSREQAAAVAGELIEVRVSGVGIGSGRTDGGTVLLPIRLHPGATLQAQILDRRGKPVPKAQVGVGRLSEDGFWLGYGLGIDTRAGADGRVRILDLSPEHSLLVAEIDSDICCREVDLSGGSADVVLSLADLTAGGVVRDLEEAPALAGGWGGPSVAAIWARAYPDGFKNLPVVSGRVRREDGSPVADGYVYLMGESGSVIGSARTGADGSYAVRAPQKGVYYATVFGSGAKCSAPITVLQDNVTAPDLVFTPPPAARITLLAPGGAPMREGTLVLVSGFMFGNMKDRDHHEPIRRSLQVGKAGAITLVGAPLPPEAQVALAKGTQQSGASHLGLDAVVEAPGVGFARLVRPDWPRQPMTVRLGPYRVLVGRVLDAAGRQVAHAKIRVEDGLHLGGSQASDTTTDQDGRFEIGSLVEDEYGLMWDQPRGQAVGSHTVGRHLRPGTERSQVSGNEPQVLVRLHGLRTVVVLTPFDGDSEPWFVRASPRAEADHAGDQSSPSGRDRVPADVAGRVVSLNGDQPVPGALVLLYELNSTPAVAGERTGPDGTFRLVVPGPGAYRVLVANQGQQIADRSAAVSPGGSRGLVIRVQVGPAIRLCLLSPSGARIGNTEVDVGVSLISARRQTMELLQATRDAWGNEIVMPQLQERPGDIDCIDLWIRAANSGCARIRLQGWPSGPVKVRLRAGVALTGQIVGAGGKAVPGVPVQVWPWNLGSGVDAANGWLSVRSGADGAFALSNVPPGPYTLGAAGNYSPLPTLTGILPECGPVRLFGTADSDSDSG